MMMKSAFNLLVSCLLPLGYCTAVYGQLPIQITEHKTTHLVMPCEIVYADLGDGENNGFEYDRNILRVKGRESGHKTNLTVITRDNDFYSFILEWHPDPKKLNYFITPYDRVRSIEPFKPVVKPETKPVPQPVPVKGAAKINAAPKPVVERKSVADLEREKLLYDRAVRLKNRPLSWQHIGGKSTHIELRVGSIYHDLDYCYVVYEIKNHSAIPYDLTYIELGVRDRKRARQSAYQETVLEEVLQVNGEKRVLPHRTNRYVGVYKKLAIPKGRLLYMEVVEQGRNLSVNIPYNKLKILEL